MVVIVIWICVITCVIDIVCRLGWLLLKMVNGLDNKYESGSASDRQASYKRYDMISSLIVIPVFVVTFIIYIRGELTTTMISFVITSMSAVVVIKALTLIYIDEKFQAGRRGRSK